MMSIGVCRFRETSDRGIYDIDTSPMSCGEVPWVESFSPFLSLVIYTERLWRAGCFTCPFRTPLPRSESEGGYTAHAMPTSGDFGDTKFMRKLASEIQGLTLGPGLAMQCQQPLRRRFPRAEALRYIF